MGKVVSVHEIEHYKRVHFIYFPPIVRSGGVGSEAMTDVSNSISEAISDALTVVPSLKVVSAPESDAAFHPVRAASRRGEIMRV